MARASAGTYRALARLDPRGSEHLLQTAPMIPVGASQRSIAAGQRMLTVDLRPSTRHRGDRQLQESTRVLVVAEPTSGPLQRGDALAERVGSIT
jgi:hypothetical protein